MRVRDFFTAGGVLIPTTLVSQAMQSLDVLWVSALFLPAATGAYGLASTIVIAGTVFSNAHGQIVLSKYGKYADDTTLVRESLGRDCTISLVLAVLLTVGCMTVGPWLLPLVFGEEYHASSAMLLNLAPYLFINHAYVLLFSLFVALGWRRQALTALAVAAVCLPFIYMLATNFEDPAPIGLAKAVSVLCAIVLMILSVGREVRGFLVRCMAVPVVVGAVLVVVMVAR